MGFVPMSQGSHHCPEPRRTGKIDFGPGLDKKCRSKMEPMSCQKTCMLRCAMFYRICLHCNGLLYQPPLYKQKMKDGQNDWFCCLQRSLLRRPTAREILVAFNILNIYRNSKWASSSFKFLDQPLNTFFLTVNLVQKAHMSWKTVYSQMITPGLIWYNF